MTDLEKLFSEYAETLGNNNQHGHWEAANIEIIRELYEIGRAAGRIEGLQEAAGECTTLAAAYHREGIVEFSRNGNMSNKKTRSLGDKASGARSAANAIRARIRKESE